MDREITGEVAAYPLPALRIVANFHASDGRSPESMEVEFGRDESLDTERICAVLTALAGVPQQRYQLQFTNAGPLKMPEAQAKPEVRP